MQQGNLWHCTAADQFLWAHWDEESLLFDCRSGQTHSLTPLAAEIIFLLEKKRLSADTIAGQLTQMFGDSDKLATDVEIAELLKQFDALGLIEECPQ